MLLVVLLLCAAAADTRHTSSGGEKCIAGQFACSDGSCIPEKWVCDGEVDCEDHSDEPATCKEDQCKSNQFECAQGSCIPHTWVCDGQLDCANGNDEQDCSGEKCIAGQFACSDGSCIPEKWVCDGEVDCDDHSDEPATCKEDQCKSNQFECAQGSCIPHTWVCDGQLDCANGNDEQGCKKYCGEDQITCNQTHWCISKLWACDGDDDCGDNSDEANCPIPECTSSEIRCLDSCMPSSWRCDGETDCLDQSDEKGCPTEDGVPPCPEYMFTCSDGTECIPPNWVCDGKPDCPKHDDEDQERCNFIACHSDQFKCKNTLNCISGHLRCNGVSDCPDGSDEINCFGEPKGNCSRTEFHCGGNKCIHHDKVCDMVADCPNGEDEPPGKCHINECSVNNGGCDQICVDTEAGHYCTCKTGYKYLNNTCKDINECESPGACSHKCINEIGSYKCECFDGYLKDPYDRSRCKPTVGHPYLIFTRKHDIRKLSVEHREMTEVVNETKSATALDYHFRTGMIFWSDVTEKKIYKAPIDNGKSRSVVISSGVSMCDGLAVDWIYNHIYWSDADKNTIEVANLDGSMKKTLYTDKIDEPRAIAVNPMDGWMYWSDWGEDARIEKGGMDGSHRSAIVTFDIKWPNGLTLDLVRQRLYWIDAKLHAISSVNYDGSERRMHLQSHQYIHHPFSISVFEDYVYWTDWESQTIFRANKFNGYNVTNLTPTRKLQNANVAHIYHPYRQPNTTNYCDAFGKTCSHICLPAPQFNINITGHRHISCACPDGLHLAGDGKSCLATLDESKNGNQRNITGADPTKLNGHNINGQPSPEPQTSQLIHEASYGGTTTFILVISILVFIVFSSTIGYYAYKTVLKDTKSMNFDNPVYRKTTEDKCSLIKSVPQRSQQEDNEDDKDDTTAFTENECV